MLLGDVGDIFSADLASDLARFRVLDSGLSRVGLEVVLLLESPHTHEVCYRYPAAGDSGIHIRDFLGKEGCRMCPNEPIGRSVHDGHVDFLRLGIMNVSQLPFQSGAYDCLPSNLQDSEHWNAYTRHMAAICRRPSVVHENREVDECRRLDEAIAADLQGRLEELNAKSPCALVVRCGNVAREFYEKVVNGNADISSLVPGDLPHPSPRGGGWHQLEQQENLVLRDVVTRLWPIQP